MAGPKPKILIIGEAQEGSLEGEVRDFLASRQDRTECRLVSKDSLSLKHEAQESDLIVMSFRSDPTEAREEDESVLPHLKDREDHLLLFAKNREDLLDVVNGLRMRSPYRMYQITPTTARSEWQIRLLDEIIVWKDKLDPGDSGEDSESPVANESKPPLQRRVLTWIEEFKGILLAVSGLLGGIVTLFAAIRSLT